MQAGLTVELVRKLLKLEQKAIKKLMYRGAVIVIHMQEYTLPSIAILPDSLVYKVYKAWFPFFHIT